MKVTRRETLRILSAALAASCAPLALAGEARKTDILTRPIPSSGERLPIIGLGSSATFRSVAGSDDVDQLKAVLKVLYDNGGRVVDTAPSYGDSEAVAGQLLNEIGIAKDMFWATKLNVAGRGGGKADEQKARAQIEASFSRIDKSPIDLIQVHNLADIPTQMGLLKELKADNKLRYIGTTCTWEGDYPDLARVMREEPIDFIGVDYAVDNTEAADEIFPIAMDRGIAVLVYVPFGRTRLWQRTEGQQLPEWAEEFGAQTWAQFFLKFAAAHPAVTCVTPATSKPKHMLDNIRAAYGTLPDNDMQKRMTEFVAALPQA